MVKLYQNPRFIFSKALISLLMSFYFIPAYGMLSSGSKNLLNTLKQQIISKSIINHPSNFQRVRSASLAPLSVNFRKNCFENSKAYKWALGGALASLGASSQAKNQESFGMPSDQVSDLLLRDNGIDLIILDEQGESLLFYAASQNVINYLFGVDKNYVPQAAIENYSVNLMWINRGLNNEQLYIYPAKNEAELKANFLKPIVGWAKKTEGGVVNVWYDSVLTPEVAIANTEQRLKKYSCKHPKIARIKLRDIRDLPKVKENSEVFSDKLPVYFRVDLARVIAAINALSSQEAIYFVYADFDMTPLSEAELFDSETVNKLQKFGTVMAYNEKIRFENGFFILGKNVENFISALQSAVVDLNIVRAKNALNGEFYTSGGLIKFKHRRGVMVPLQQIVYHSYWRMFPYFYSLEGYGSLKVKKKYALIFPYYEEYDKAKHGLVPFGEKHLDLDTLSYTVKTDVKYPTKEVDIPPASLNYD